MIGAASAETRWRAFAELSTDGSASLKPSDQQARRVEARVNALMALHRIRDTRNAFSQQASDLPVGRLVDRGVQPSLQKYFASPVGQIISTNSRHPTPQEGRIAIVTNAGRDAVDAAASCGRWDRRAGSYVPVSGQQHADERCCSVRRSRVVLTPRRWRQVRGG
jgi:hypothetical protein